MDMYKTNKKKKEVREVKRVTSWASFYCMK